MVTHRINPAWQDEIKLKIAEHIEIDTTQSWLPCVQWLITRLSKSGIPSKLYNLGAGVKRVTTVTDTCPLCHNKIKGYGEKRIED